METDEYKKVYFLAIRMLAARPYTVAGLKKKLEGKGTLELIDLAVEQLISAKFLNDTDFAEGYARIYQGRWGRNKTAGSLYRKGVPKEIIKKVLDRAEEEQDPVEEAIVLLERYQTKHKDDKQKAIRFIANRGFSFSVALSAWEKYLSNLE